MDVTTREAADRLGVTQSRVRALIAARTLRARRVGSQWLIDLDSVEHQAALIAAQATSRSMSSRVAWAVGDLVDGGDAGWLSAAERSRLRKRINAVPQSAVVQSAVVQKWLTSRSSRLTRYRVGARDIEALLARDGVVRTGASATIAYKVGLGGGGAADAYVTAAVGERLVSDFFLIESRDGNLTLRQVDHDLHVRTARRVDEHLVAPRVMVSVDLAADSDVRTRSVGRALMDSTLTEFRAGS